MLSARMRFWSMRPTAEDADHFIGSRPMKRLRAIDMVGTMELY
jgi:hypothetical protein